MVTTKGDWKTQFLQSPQYQFQLNCTSYKLTQEQDNGELVTFHLLHVGYLHIKIEVEAIFQVFTTKASIQAHPRATKQWMTHVEESYLRWSLDVFDVDAL